MNENVKLDGRVHAIKRVPGRHPKRVNAKTKSVADTLLRNIGVGVNEKRRTEAVRVIESGDAHLIEAVRHGEAGLRTAADRAFLRAEILDELRIDPVTLKASAKAKLASVRRQLEKKLKAEHEARIKGLDEEVRQRVLTETKDYLARLHAMEAEAKQTIEVYREFTSNANPTFTSDEFKLILMCLHPDGQRTAERLNDAFRLFNAKRVRLTGQKGQ